ncbi:MAG: pyrroline-5-carboxylate reductase [Planctomyces sp.]|nr:pyrroline-5-carboxylate reductase [Planctomyces sp.]
MFSGKIGFIGSGQMATALAKGFVAAGMVQPEQLLAYDVLPASAERFVQSTGGRVMADVTGLTQEADVIFLSVKPQAMAAVLKNLADVPASREKLVISIAAGITLATLEAGLGGAGRIVRVMPNTPALVGAGASAFTLSKGALAHSATSPGDAAIVRQLLETVGVAEEVPETLMDAVTGLSGSGPAYVYQIIEALSDGGVRVGLPRATATRLAAQTLLGAAKMVLETGEHPGVLKDAVTSPGGTTIAGLHALEAGGLRAALMNAVVAATSRAKELGQPAK